MSVGDAPSTTLVGELTSTSVGVRGAASSASSVDDSPVQATSKNEQVSAAMSAERSFITPRVWSRGGRRPTVASRTRPPAARARPDGGGPATPEVVQCGCQCRRRDDVEVDVEIDQVARGPVQVISRECQQAARALVVDGRGGRTDQLAGEIG